MKILISTLVTLALGISLHAQNKPKPGMPPVPKPPGGQENPAIPPIPGVVNVPAKKAPAAHNHEAMAAADGQVIDGSNWNDQGVADAYHSYTKKRVLLSSATQNLEIRFYQRGPLTNRQAANLLVKVLDMEGFVFVPSGANEVKLLPKGQGTGSNGPAELEDIIDDPNNIPQGDNYISYFMKLGFIKPEEAVRTFTQSIHGLGPGAKIAPVPNASAVIITGKATFVRKLINQKRYIDVPTGNVDTTWVSLRYADAEEIATTLNGIMNAQQQRKTTAGVTSSATRGTGNRPPVPGVPKSAGTSNTASTSAGEDIPVQIVANPRLNKLFIMGRPVDIVFVEGLAREFDAPPNKNTFIKRKLRFMIASDFLQVAANALQAQSSSSSQTAGNQGGGRQATQNRNQNRNTGNTGNTGRTGQGGNGGSSGSESVQEFNVSDVPESMVIGKTFIVADNLANSILVQGPPESLRIVSELIDKLDGRPQQVMISTVFGEMSLGDGHDIGMSIGRVSKANGATTGSRSDGAGNFNSGIGLLQDLDTLGTIAGLGGTGGLGLNIYGRVKNVTGMIHALKTNSDFKILSRPTVYTSNNRKAVISSGTRIAVPTNQFNSGATGQSTNIEYRDVLLRFEVVPLINSDEEVTLRISLVNDTVGENQTIGSGANALTVPTIGTETISTTVTVRNGSTVVLGGLVTETERNTKTGVPGLRRIPVLGRLFSRDIKDIDRRELLIFIQPTIISGEETQRSAQADMERRYDVAPTARSFADGVLPPKKRKSRTATPPKKSKKRGRIPVASKRPSLRYPTRR